jgi:hypothetical protein
MRAVAAALVAIGLSTTASAQAVHTTASAQAANTMSGQATDMVGSAPTGDAIDTTHKPIEIAPQALRAALPRFGDIEGLHMIFLSEDVENRITAGVSGDLTRAEALERLLRGTDLTYQFLDARTVMILPAGLATGAPVEPNSTSAPAGDAGHGADGTANTEADADTRGAQVTITAARQSDAQRLEYYRLLAATSRGEYRRLLKNLRFADSGTVTFRGFAPPLGRHRQSATMGGIVLSRIFNVASDSIERHLVAYNGNSFPVFVEIDSETALGNGAYAALAPGESAVWTWRPIRCGGGGGGGSADWRQGRQQLQPWGCADHPLQPGTFRLRMLKEWDTGSRGLRTPLNGANTR